MIEALVFDFDGLILDTETPIIEAWMAVHDRAGVTCNREHALSVVGHVDVKVDLWQAFAAEVDRAGLIGQHKQLSKKFLENKTTLPGVLDYLTAARQRGMRLAIASNSSHGWVNRHLMRLGLSTFFELICCREDVVHGKPEPDLYRAVLDSFRLVGRQAISFEDSNPGSVAAKSAGLWSVTVSNPSTRHHDFEHADIQLGSLAELSLEELLERIAALGNAS